MVNVSITTVPGAVSCLELFSKFFLHTASCLLTEGGLQFQRLFSLLIFCSYVDLENQ